MAIDAKAVISIGLWPTVISELNERLLSHGLLGTFEEPVTITGRFKKWIALKCKHKLR